ncbi:MAG: hypothetical protein QOF73_5009 [Thermomicrobiales bacterium]|nr:hypothetical protein [Thermomicrobiales bacterium]
MHPPVYHYDIHGIVTVVAEARLPELEAFRVDDAILQPTIRVRICQVPQEPRSAPGESEIRHVRYAEGHGPIGFRIGIDYRDTVEVFATPFLARSPHVLYTNVVEPILRWTFVEKGFALVHGACLAFGNDAFIVTARTDTGKTTTVLRVLDNRPDAAFLSDDLTLLAPDGRVLPYPKPLTISRHTLVAVKTPLLSWAERLALVVQSRLHSKTGRRFGLLLSAARLPMATTNAIVQAVIPPPKYHVQRLVPGVRMASEARLAGLIVIERGAEGTISLSHGEALEILMRNCEDSYGFPPYPEIKEVLYAARGEDLRPRERDIVDSALAGCPAALLRSETRSWWQQLPVIADSIAEGFAGLRPAQATPGTVATPAD